MSTSPPTPRPPITTAATAFAHSYARAMHLSPTAPLPLTAATLAVHYGPHTTAYSLGQRVPMGASDGTAAASIRAHLERYERSGLGCDVRLVGCRVEVVSEMSALCWLSWRIWPRNGVVEGWVWECVYGYRRGEEVEAMERIGGEEGWEKPEGWWELVVSDNEVLGLLERVPGFFQL